MGSRRLVDWLVDAVLIAVAAALLLAAGLPLVVQP